MSSNIITISQSNPKVEAVPSAPNITMTAEAYQRIQHWVDICPFEISGLGLVEEVPGGYHVPEIFLLKQEGSGSETTIDQEDYGRLMHELHQRGDGSMDRLVFWWHSHVNMNCFWSSQDEEAITEMLGGRPYAISIVFNKRNEYRARIDYGHKNFRFKLDDLKFSVSSPIPEEGLADFVTGRAAERCEAQEDGSVDLFELGRKIIEVIIEGGGHLPSPSAFDLGLKDDCQEQYGKLVKPVHTQVWNQRAINDWRAETLGYEKSNTSRKRRWTREHYNNLIKPVIGRDGIDVEKISQSSEAILDAYEYMLAEAWKEDK